MLVDGGTWTNTNQIQVGNEGVGSLTVQNFGAVTANDLLIGLAGGSNGAVTVDETSQIDVTNFLQVGGGFFNDNGTPGDPSDDFGIEGSSTRTIDR